MKRILSWVLLVLAFSSVALAQEETSALLPLPPPLQPIALPEATGDVVFGTLEFEPPPPPRPRSHKKGTAARPPEKTDAGTVTFGTIEYEMPPGSEWPAGSVRVVEEGGNEYVRLPDGSEVRTNADGSITTLKPDGTQTTTTVEIDSIEFEETPQAKAKATLERLRKAVQKALSGHRKTKAAIDKAMDKMAARSNWFAREIPGGNAQVGTVTADAGVAGMPEALYQAPSSLPADRVVPIRATLVAGGAETTARAVVNLLNVDAVLEARWTFEERYTFSLNRTVPGPAGPTIAQEQKTETTVGSGHLRFEARPFPGQTEAEAEEFADAALKLQGVKGLRQVRADGSVGLQGDGGSFRSGPSGSDRASTSVSGFGRLETTPSEHANLVLQRDGKGWRLVEWNDVLAAPRYSAQELALLSESRLGQHTPGSPEWSVRTLTWSTVNDRRNQSIQLYSPLAKPEQSPAPDERVSRHGSLVLAPAGQGRYTGFLRFDYTYSPPSDNVSTFQRFRSVTWDFTLQIVEEK